MQNSRTEAKRREKLEASTPSPIGSGLQRPTSAFSIISGQNNVIEQSSPDSTSSLPSSQSATSSENNLQVSEQTSRSTSSHTEDSEAESNETGRTMSSISTNASKVSVVSTLHKSSERHSQRSGASLDSGNYEIL